MSSPDYLESSYRNTFNWLPRKLHARDPSITLSLPGIENDAVAENGKVTATHCNMYNQDKIQPVAKLFHEMHNILRKPYHFAVEKQDKGLIYFFNVILNEGSADMTGKPTNIFNDDTMPIGLDYKFFLLSEADSIIHQANVYKEEMARSEGKKFKTEKDYRNLVVWTNGHNPGYFMTDIMVRNGRRNRLLKNTQNSFKFVELYNKAAKKPTKTALF